MSKNQRHGGKSGHHDHDSHHSGHKSKLLVGTNGDNVLVGTGRKDVILGRNGDDSIDGGDGNDLLFGDKGNDQLFGGDGRDFLFGGKGNDLLDGGAGNDSLFGDKGNDKLLGGTGNDKLLGGKGDDFLDGGAGSDYLFGDKGNDTFNFTASENIGAKDYYDGGKGFDTLRLTLTTAEAELAKDEINAFRAFLEDGCGTFRFDSFGLSVRNFEKLEVVTVGGENTAPVAVGDNYGAVEDQALVILVPGVLANDSDAESSPLTLTAMLVTGPTSGTLTLNDNGSFTYTPMADFFGEDSFTYKAFDGALNSNEATVTLQVAPVNDAPVAVDDIATVTEDSSGNVIDVLGNDTNKGAPNESGQNLIVSAPSASHGAVVVNQDGTLSYTPDADYFGADTINYTITDNGTTDGVADPLADSAQVAVIVTGVNDAPVAVDDTITDTALDGRIRVAVVGVENVGTHAAAAGQLDATKFFAEAIDYTPTTNWATFFDNYEVVVIGDSGFFDYRAETGIFSALSNFVDQGGGVVTTGWFAGALSIMADSIKGDADHITPVAPDGKNETQLNASITITAFGSDHEITDDIPSPFQSSSKWVLANKLDANLNPLATGVAADPDQLPKIGTVLPTIAYADEVGRDDVAELPGGKTAYLGGMYLANSFFNPDATRSDVQDEIFEQAVAWAAGARSGPAAATVIIDVLANDTDVDTAHTDLFIQSFTQPGALGAATSVDANGDIVYTLGAQQLQQLQATPSQSVTDSFNYTVSDGSGGFDTASVSLTITGLTDAIL